MICLDNVEGCSLGAHWTGHNLQRCNISTVAFQLCIPVAGRSGSWQNKHNSWQSRFMTEQVHGRVGSWQNKFMAEQVHGRTSSWQNKFMAEQVHGRTARLRQRPIPIAVLVAEGVHGRTVISTKNDYWSGSQTTGVLSVLRDTYSCLHNSRRA